MNIKQLREKIGISQQGLSDRTGIPRPRIAKWEEGKGNPKLDDYRTLENFFRSYGEFVINGDNKLSDRESEPYIKKRLRQKNNNSKLSLAPLIPVKAQAGYVKAIDQETFIDTLEKYALPPGVNPQGAVWRYWEIEGDSMEPTFHSGDYILTSQVHHLDWQQLRNFYLYVIVTDERVLFKRLFCKNDVEWVLISENEDQYPQQLLPVESIKEVWVFRRHIVNHAPPTKQFIIKV